MGYIVHIIKTVLPLDLIKIGKNLPLDIIKNAQNTL